MQTHFMKFSGIIVTKIRLSEMSNEMTGFGVRFVLLIYQ